MHTFLIQKFNILIFEYTNLRISDVIVKYLKFMYSTIFKSNNSLPLSVTNMIYILITPNTEHTTIKNRIKQNFTNQTKNYF